ncbi:MAG: alpha/beta hydrolase [Chloroflexi bacterium]|nr:alpha/beta hydrolase [Chloroflexota bacterium]
MRIDPAQFRPEAISPEMSAFNSRLKDLMAQEAGQEITPAYLRRRRREGSPWQSPQRRLEVGIDESCPGAAGPIPLRVFVPDRCDAVYLHIHGGGWVFGGADLEDENHWRRAQECSIAVVSVDYRLAPENPYPAAPDDCEAAALWLIENSAERFGTERLLIGGESAGANLSAVTMLRLRDRHGFAGWSGADLMYGAYEFAGGTPSRRIIGRNSLVLRPESMEMMQRGYFRSADRTDPDVSPLRASLHDLPPALFSCGTADPLLDDSLFMHARWIAAGNRAEIAIYPGATHAFDDFGAPPTEASHLRRYEFIRAAIAG